MKKNTELSSTTESGLVPSNPLVVRMAKRLRWSPERAVARIQRALPAPLEQQIYLELASDFGIHPETMSKILRFYLGENNLQIEDLEPRPIGQNLVVSKFASFAEFLGGCLDLLKLVSSEYGELGLSVMHVANIVQHYGIYEPERLIETIDTNIDEMTDMLGIGDDRGHADKMRLCIWLVVTKIIPEQKRNGCPDVIDIADIMTVLQESRREFRRLTSEYAEGLHDMSPTDSGRVLKRYGV